MLKIAGKSESKGVRVVANKKVSLVILHYSKVNLYLTKVLN